MSYHKVPPMLETKNHHCKAHDLPSQSQPLFNNIVWRRKDVMGKCGHFQWSQPTLSESATHNDFTELEITYSLWRHQVDQEVIPVNHGKAAAGEPFWGCSATYQRFKMVEFDRGKHGLQSALAIMFMFLNCWPCFWADTQHLQMEPMVSARHSNTSNKYLFSLQQTSSLFCSRDGRISGFQLDFGKYSRTVDKDIDKDTNEDQPYSQSQKRSF